MVQEKKKRKPPKLSGEDRERIAAALQNVFLEGAAPDVVAGDPAVAGLSAQSRVIVGYMLGRSLTEEGRRRWHRLKLPMLVGLRQEVDRLIDLAGRQAIAEKSSLDAIGAAIGTSKQRAYQRFGDDYVEEGWFNGKFGKERREILRLKNGNRQLVMIVDGDRKPIDLHVCEDDELAGLINGLRSEHGANQMVPARPGTRLADYIAGSDWRHEGARDSGRAQRAGDDAPGTTSR